MQKLLTVKYSKDAKKIGTDVSGADWYGEISSVRDKKWMYIDEEPYFVGYSKIEDTTLLVMFPRSEYRDYLIPVLTASILGSAISFAIMLALIIVLIGRVVKPITDLSGKLRNVAQGDLSTVLATNETDEVGELSRHVAQVVDVFNEMGTDIKKLIVEFDINGDLDYRMDTQKYNGAYKEIAEQINTSWY